MFDKPKIWKGSWDLSEGITFLKWFAYISFHTIACVSPASLMRHLIMHFRTTGIVWTFCVLFMSVHLIKVCVYICPTSLCVVPLFFSSQFLPHLFLFLVHFVNFIAWSCGCPFGMHSIQTKVKDWLLVITHFLTQKCCFSVWKDNIVTWNNNDSHVKQICCDLLCTWSIITKPTFLRFYIIPGQ